MTVPHPIRHLRRSLAPVPVTYHVERYERLDGRMVRTASYDLAPRQH